MTTEILTCSRCSTPITLHSKSGLCARCARHAVAQRSKFAIPPSDAQRANWGSFRRERQLQHAVTPLDGSCRHHWKIPSTTEDSTYPSECALCGMQKTFRPGAAEDAARSGRNRKES